MNETAEPSPNRQIQSLHSIHRRVAAFCASHWDLNALWQLDRDARETLELAEPQTESGALDAVRRMQEILSGCLAASALPSDAQSRQLHELSAQGVVLGATAPIEAPLDAPRPAPAAAASTRFETPPAAYWRQWADDADAPGGAGTESAPTTDTASTRNPDMTDANATDDATGALDPSAKHLRVYHLTEYGPLSIAIDQLLEREGITLEQLDSEDELAELLQALPADLLLVDPGFAGRIDRIAGILQDYRKANPKPLAAVQISDAGSGVDTAGPGFSVMDAIVSASADPRTIVARIDQLLRFGKSEQYRVLIVEDDRSQAMFAEGILRNAEIATKVLLEAGGLLASIAEFKPDLILMDLHMPDSSGIELTGMIRQSRQFQNIPIVFLSGESDEDRQLDALEAGGDDFLAKPIAPRRLIAAVQNRIKRHRALLAGGSAARAAATGSLMQRNDMLALLKQRIGRDDHALFFIDLNGANLLKDRIGLSALETLLKAFSGFLVQCCEPSPVARFGDGSFVMAYEGDCADNLLVARADTLRRQLMSQRFEVQEQAIEFRVNIGICHFEYAQGSTDILVNAGERSARQARGTAGGIAVYRPQTSTEAQREEQVIALLSAGDGANLSHVYQPIVAVAGSTEKQFQTLLRLTDADGQVIPAADFIPVAEKSNLIVAVDRWSLSKAVATIAERKAAGDEIKLFVNQSNLTLLDGGQPNWLKNLLKAYGLPDSSLVIEINHNDALLNQQSMREFCQALIQDGVQFCLSRYNPRNDEANLLEALPISYVKLAQKLTAELASAQVREQVKTLVDGAHRRGLEVIAHSVEDAQSAATLWMSGIDFIQGNLVQSANATLEFGFDQSVL